MDHVILQPLSPDQQTLIDVIGSAWRQTGRWPVVDYVARTAPYEEGGLDAALSRLPAIRGVGNATYRLFHTTRGWPAVVPDDRIGLTIAGLWRATGIGGTAAQLVKTIATIAEQDGGLAPQYDKVVSLSLLALDLVAHDWPLYRSGWSGEKAAEALQYEPPLWGAWSAADGHLRPDSQRVRHFRGVVEPEDYVSRLVIWFGDHTATAAPQRLRSPLGLPEALGYLDAIWRMRYGTPLLNRVRPAAAAKLALPCETADEFDARLSALADLLGTLDVRLDAEGEQEATKRGERSLARLRRRLTSDLAPSAASRAGAAVGTLQEVVRIRVGGQHSGTGSEVVRAFATLGLRYPPTDWGAAWEEVRDRCSDAVTAVREELEVGVQ